MNDVTEALSLDTLVDAVSEQLLRAQARRIAADRGGSRRAAPRSSR